MDINKILRQPPKRFFDPIHEKWIKWTGNSLLSYDYNNPYECDCNWCDRMKIWMENGIYICVILNVCITEIEEEACLHVIEVGRRIIIECDISNCLDEIELECDDCINPCKLPELSKKRTLKFKFEI